MKLRTLLAGDQGYLYVDLLVALTIISLTAITLFSAGTTLKNARVKTMTAYHQAWTDYEEQILEKTD